MNNSFTDDSTIEITESDALETPPPLEPFNLNLDFTASQVVTVNVQPPPPPRNVSFAVCFYITFIYLSLLGNFYCPSSPRKCSSKSNSDFSNSNFSNSNFSNSN
jgi:hypothetical protein